MLLAKVNQLPKTKTFAVKLFPSDGFPLGLLRIRNGRSIKSHGKACVWVTIGMVFIWQTRLQMNYTATLLLFTDITLKQGIVWPAIRKGRFRDEPDLVSGLLKFLRFIHLDEGANCQFVGFQTYKVSKVLGMRLDVAFRQRVCYPCTGEQVPNNMMCLNPTYPSTEVFGTLGKNYVISGQLLKRLFWRIYFVIGFTILNMRNSHCGVLSNMA